MTDGYGPYASSASWTAFTNSVAYGPPWTRAGGRKRDGLFAAGQSGDH
jgi:hypothetical protein